MCVCGKNRNGDGMLSTLVIYDDFMLFLQFQTGC